MRLVFFAICGMSLSCGCAFTTPDEGDHASSSAELDRIQGKWEAIAHEFKGPSAPREDEFFPYSLTFGGHAVSVQSGTKVEQAKVVLEPNLDPKKITFEYPPHFASWGTYTLNDDELIISWATGKSTEPSEDERATVVLKRIKTVEIESKESGKRL